jgi:hypothetical protein
MRAERDDTRPADGRQPREVERWRSNLGHRSALIDPPEVCDWDLAGTASSAGTAERASLPRAVVKVSERLDEKHPSSSDGGHVCTLPGSLVTRIPEEPHDSSQDQGH